MDITSQIIAYEQGELDQDEVVALFQALVDSGLAWQLQGHYGRTTAHLLQIGHITAPSLLREQTQVVLAEENRAARKLRR